jgi:hypothetical protein
MSNCFNFKTQLLSITNNNYAIEHIEGYPSNNFGYGQKCRFDIIRIGDLVRNFCLFIKLPENDYVDNINYEIIKSYCIIIGGITVMNINRDQLYTLKKKIKINKNNELYIPLYSIYDDLDKLIPLIALQYHQVTIEIEFEESDKLISNLNLNLNLNLDFIDCYLLQEFVYLDVIDRNFYKERTIYLPSRMYYLIDNKFVIWTNNKFKILIDDAVINNVMHDTGHMIDLSSVNEINIYIKNGKNEIIEILENENFNIFCNDEKMIKDKENNIFIYKQDVNNKKDFCIEHNISAEFNIIIYIVLNDQICIKDGLNNVL